ncbi:hypothetical protein J2X11_000464 [Aeromicrobium panaciterrae]|uniref:Uncharacterized protein n=1 Tax=Aeromicrobium panaciterrae TaxID=363861 RepID=A0ABU1UKE1_9ACTN|nr:hypothetical protein [Aeromicrobium panaciterrae]MDR7085625.1 hypothetical protein [Aeromicrobium panaciterrae]
MRRSTAILSAAVVALTTAISMSPAHAAAFHLTASISTPSAQWGDGPIMDGQLTPVYSGRTVYLQRYYSDSWHTVDTTLTDDSGNYHEHLTPDELKHKVGSMKFRARVLGHDGYTADSSPTVTKTIYGWQSLAHIDATYGDSRRFVDGEDQLVVNFQVADRSWQVKNPLVNEVGRRYTKWNLQEKCLQLRGFAGIDDDSNASAQGRVLIGIDGTAYDDVYSFSPHDYQPLDKNLHKTKYLTFKAYKLNEYATTVGVGVPEVNCSKKLPTNY